MLHLDAAPLAGAAHVVSPVYAAPPIGATSGSAIITSRRCIAPKRCFIRRHGCTRSLHGAQCILGRRHSASRRPAPVLLASMQDHCGCCVNITDIALLTAWCCLSSRCRFARRRCMRHLICYHRIQELHAQVAPGQPLAFFSWLSGVVSFTRGRQCARRCCVAHGPFLC